MPRAPLRIGIAVAVLALAATAAWLLRDADDNGAGDGSGAARTVPVIAIDPANEGRRVSATGEIVAATPARDTQLGIVADDGVVVLIRRVEMWQWHEDCAAGECGYRAGWDEQAVDSSRFREAADHANPGALPFTTTRFTADGISLGAFALDAEAAAALGDERPLPVEVEALQPNLAASFRDDDGLLYTGADPATPQIGDLRIGYRVVEPGRVTVVGVQRQGRLIPASR